MSGFTIHEMENVARSMGPVDLGNDIGNVIEISSSGGGNDPLGLSMLTNFGRGSSGGGGGSSESKQITIDSSNSFGGGSGGNRGLSEIEIGGMETLEPITLNLGGGPSFNGSSAPVEIQFSKAQDDKPGSSIFSDMGANSGGIFSNSQTASGPISSLSPAPAPRLSPEEERKEKIELINKLQRLEAKGLPVSRKYTMDNTLEEIKQEYARLVDARNLEASLRFQRQMLMSVTTGVEWLNGRFDPLDLKLDGWSESVHENIEDFDEIFEELYDKYKERGKMPPEARLIMALAGSGFMCHVSNTFLRSRMPSADDILKNNPDIARQFAAAAAKQAGPGFGNFMSMAMNGGAQQPGPAPVGGQAGAFFGSSQAPPMAQMPQPVAAMEPRSTARREMRGPTGVDDILKTFEEVRRNEELDGTPLSAPMGNPEMQPAVAAAMEIQSIGTADDLGSTGESIRTAGGSRGRRRRAMPVSGNVFSLNV